LNSRAERLNMLPKDKLCCRVVLCLAAGYINWISTSQAQSLDHYAPGEGGWDDRFDALGVDGPVYALALAGREIYIGGNFTKAGEVSANNVARWDGNNWHALGNGIPHTGATAIVYTLAVTAGGKLYAGGQFATAGNGNANNVAVWNGNDWARLGDIGSRGTNSTVYALAASGNEIFAGGIFTIAGNISANGVAKWDGAQWSRLGTTLTNGVTGGSAYALAVLDELLFTGGDFATAGNIPAQNIARWNITTGAWSAFAQGVNGKVQSIAGNYFGEVVAGGLFTSASGTPVNRIARWNGNAWSSLGAGSANGVTGEVRAVAASGSYLYVGGEFHEAGGEAVNSIARWDRNNWSTLGAGVAGVVHALASDSSAAVFVGGQFLSAGGIPAKNFSIWYEETNAVKEKNAKFEIRKFELYPNYPNPFNPSTTIKYFLPSAQFVTLQVFNTNGQEVATLVQGRRSAGEQHVQFDAYDLSAGVYFCRLAAGAFGQTRKMILLR
jgi:hypothetical protein